MTAVLELTAGVLAGMLVIMGIAWAAQRTAGDGGLVDVFWSFGTGACIAAACLAPIGDAGAPWRRVLSAGLMLAWGLRLGGYILARVVRSKTEDARYAAFRRDWGADFQRNMLGLTLVQAPAAALLAISVIAAARAPAAALRAQDIAALAVFLLATGGEALADEQMRRFRADPTNHGRVCHSGLWAWSRHPNYFFEAAIWWTWPIMGLDLHRPASLATLLAPVLMYLLLRYGSGVPPLEETMLASRGQAWRDYQRRVSIFIPLPPKA